LFDKATQLWTKLEEDQQVQRWDKEEERISTTIQDLKQRQKTMPITEHVKGAQDMKKLQAELTTVQTLKKECQAQMEPLQERVAEVIAQVEEAKTHIAQTQAECAGLISDEIAAQIVDTLKEKTRRCKHKQRSSRKSSRRSPGRSMKHTKVRWLGTSHMSVLGACWKQTKVESKVILGKKACTRKATTGRKNNMHACMEDLTTLGLGFW
jgi:chromosome segregation ATPase